MKLLFMLPFFYYLVYTYFKSYFNLNKYLIILFFYVHLFFFFLIMAICNLHSMQMNGLSKSYGDFRMLRNKQNA